jgi:hypothetical protein
MNYVRTVLLAAGLFYMQSITAQTLSWQNVDSLYGPLPPSVHVFRTSDSLDGKPNIAYYVLADLKDRSLNFTADTTNNRRLTPTAFYEKNQHPLLVVNCTFFSFETNQNLNTVIRDGKMLAYNIHSIPGRGRDTLLYHHTYRSAIGITKKGKADIAWLYTDSSFKHPIAFQQPLMPGKDSFSYVTPLSIRSHSKRLGTAGAPVRWKKVKTAVGGGPVLVKDGVVFIANDIERMFAGKAMEDKHPRTAMGYTADGKLVVLVVQGRFPGLAEGADLRSLAVMMIKLGCVEALNLDGGGSSCLLVNGKETIKPSDKGVQRPVPAVFMIGENK